MEKIFNIKYTPCHQDGGFSFGNMESAYSATSRYLTKNGNPILPISGEIHFSRCERDDWKRELLKMKECGLTAIANYVFWNHHEMEKGVFRWDGNRDIKEFLRLCREVKLNVILRIGPWCHGEMRFGGFPDWLMLIPGKRKDTASYLNYVERFWRALYGQIREFCDGETILGIQLENEYNGSISHIHTLRRIAEKIGFQVPFFTMTAWPTNTPDPHFLPMMGGYPEAPWTQNKKPLVGRRRFAICGGRTETEIGEDLIRTKREKASFDDFPYAGCEVGTGNQVTQHRRPIISDKDGYGVAFSKFASGMNLMGYYMFHGGRNPRGELLQESRRTFYPNNYPIVDYDFQAPFSKDGVCRRHGDRLRLLHLFIQTWDPRIACKQAFFSQEKELPYTSVRCDGDMSGTLFVSNYERGWKASGVTLTPVLKDGGKEIRLPALSVAKDELFFIPFRFKANEVEFDYITAQPIARVEHEGKTDLYFMRLERQPVLVSINGEERQYEDEAVWLEEHLCLHFMERERALRFHLIEGRPIFSGGTVWVENSHICAQLTDGETLEFGSKEWSCQANLPADAVRLRRIQKIKLPFDSYLYSHGKRGYYRLNIQMDLLGELDDLVVELAFQGLNLQVFCGGTLVDDYFNTDGLFELHIRHFRDLLVQNHGEVILKTAASTNHGIGNVYSEIPMPAGMENLSVKKVRPVILKQVSI